MDPILDFICKVDRIVKILQNKDDCDHNVKDKNSKKINFFDNLNQIDDKIINADLNLSFRDIAIKTEDVLQYLIYSLPANLKKTFLENKSQNQTEINQLQSVLRRLLSNYVNNEENIKDKNGRSLVEKYGLRILICTDDGYVLHDVQTFTGKNNNYCVQFTDQNISSVFPQKITLNSSNIDLSNLSNTVKSLQQLKVIKCSSSVEPKTHENSKNEYKIFNSANNVIEEKRNNSFEKLQILDNHSTRTEIMQAKMAKYGLSARKSDTTNNFNWYVARHIASDVFQNKETNITLRVSFYEK